MCFLLLSLVVMAAACQRSAPASRTTSRPAPLPAADIPDYSPYVRQGVVFFAVGHAPDWGLMIQPDRRMHFRGSPDSLSVSTPTPIVAASGERTYEGRANGNWLKATLRPTPYSSRQTGQTYAYTVQISLRKGRGEVRTYMGGGTALHQLLLLSGNWQIISLQDKPVPATGRQPFIDFQPAANRVLGSGPCNRFSGTFRADNGSIRLSPLATTRMACPDNASNAFDNELVKTLSGTFTYGIDRGQLTLSRAGKVILTARRSK